MRFSRLQMLTAAITLLIAAAFFAGFGAPVASAQVTTAAIHGTVTDPSGAVLPGATVKVLNTATGISSTATANQNGYYSFPSLQIGGPYTVTVTAAGFHNYVATGITLTVNSNREVNAQMSLGTTSQTVTVSASAVQVETTNTQLQQIIPQSQIENLPILGRDAASLEKLVPGVVESSDRFGSFSSNGSQTTDNSYLINGIDNNDGPLQNEGLIINPDALAEQNDVTSTMNPQFARNGGSVVNQVIKSGTNQFHGSGFEYYRDTFLNNGSYFSHIRPPFHQNLYGGTLGGPVLKNKLFFFAAYQGMRNRTGLTTQTPVFQSGILPGTNTPGGNFSTENNIVTSGPDGTAGLSSNLIPFDIKTGPGSANPGVMCGPGTNYPAWNTVPATSNSPAIPGCFPTGSAVSIDPSSFNSVALALAQKYVPAGNAGSTAAPYYNFNTADSGAADQGILNANYTLGTKDNLIGTAVFQSSPSTATLGFGGSDLPGFGTIQAEHFKLFSASEAHTFNANHLNNLRVGYYRFNFASVVPANIVAPSSLGFNIHPNNPLSGVPYMSLTGLFSLGFSREGPQPRIDTNLTAADDYTWIFGKHTLMVGTLVEQFLVRNPYSSDNNGAYSYQGAGTFSSGDPGIDFLLGIPDSFTQTSGGFVDTRAWEFYSYAQDSWRATQDLTINYGLAWDTETPNTNDQFNGVGITCFIPGNQTSNVFPGGFAGLLFPGDPGCNKQGGATTKFDHFGPRFGFAWSPSDGPAAVIGASGSHQFSLRGGFGIYFNRDQQEGQLQNLGDMPNFKNSIGAAELQTAAGTPGSPAFLNPFSDVAPAIDGPLSEASPFPYTPPPPGTKLDWSQYTYQDISVISPNYDVPYTYNYNLNIQRQLGNSMILQVGYVGSMGRKLALAYEGDPITAAGHAACLANPNCVANINNVHLHFPQYSLQPTIFGGSPAYLSVGTLGTEGMSNYNSLQASLTHNMAHGLYFSLAYTFAHSLDNSSGLESSAFNGGGYNQYPGYQHLSYGNSDFDARHRFVASYDYRIPLLASMNQQPIIKTALANWHVAGYSVMQTGFPVVITDFGAFLSGYCDQYSYYACPDTPSTSSFSIPTQNIRSTFQKTGTATWFSNSTFSQEPVGGFGNVSRGLIHGPGFNYTDLSIYKQFPLGSDNARSLQLMLQATNAFNHANFAQPDGNFTDGPYFGTVNNVIQSADYNQDPTPGRVVQLVGRITF